jgi:DeoR/GlpR family transcriptional regulator of sugar metabolism
MHQQVNEIDKLLYNTKNYYLLLLHIMIEFGMLQLERQLKIMSLLTQREAVKIAELSNVFGVSQNTIRRDLQTLADKGFLSITHGGAVLNSQAPMGLPIDQREIRNIQEKRAIGMKAAELITNGEAIILDAGTTTYQIAKALKGKKRLTVITNAFNIAMELSVAQGITVVMTGGILNEITGCLAGFHAEQFISQFHVNRAFISAGGVSLDSVTNTNAFEVQIKRSMMAVAEESYLVVTHHKIGQASLAPFAVPEDFQAILTDSGLDLALAEKFRSRGVEVILC